MADKKKSTFMDVLRPFGRVKGFYESVHAYMTAHDIQSLHMFYVLFFITLLPLFIFSIEGAKMLGVILILLSPIWLFPALIFAIWNLWIDYIQLQFLSDDAQTPQLYELVLPKNITKSPVAMELFLEGLLLSQGTTTGFDVYWKGRVQPWWSLEIAGINGEVKLYFWCWKRFKEHVEAQLYAQYPEVKMIPVDDYAANVDIDPKKYFTWGCRYKLTKEEALPIKTYYDYGLHENADKWETKVDPMVNILEKIGLAKQGEQFWLQIIFTKSKRDIAGEAEEMIEKIYKDKTPEYPAMDGSDEKVQGFPMLLPSERAKVEAIQRASKKPAFDVIIRTLYIAELDKMDTLRIQSIGKMFAAYDGFNSLAAYEGRGPGGDYPWQKWTMPNQDKVNEELVRAYQLRGGFYAPYKRPSITLTTEELATIYHFPSRESAVPGMEKAQSKSAAPPINLPT